MRSEVTKSASISAVAYRVMVALVLLAPLRVHADDPPQYGWREEVWAGAQASGNVWLLYSGLTVAPHSHMFDDGLRLRVTSGYGGYSYEGLSGRGTETQTQVVQGSHSIYRRSRRLLETHGPADSEGISWDLCDQP